MNKERLQQLINVMQRVADRNDEIDLVTWQNTDAGTKHTEEEAHECGTVCCVAGWLALSPEFHAAGGRAAGEGCPVFGTEGGFERARYGTEAVQTFLETSKPLARVICGVHADGSGVTAEFYTGESHPTQSTKVDAKLVVTRLTALLKSI
jgi:hypothetical protein